MRHIFEAAYEAAQTHVSAESRWGSEFDNKNTLNDWASYTIIYLARGVSGNATREQARDGLMKAAGLLLGAIERFDEDRLSPRHYEKPVRGGENG